MRVYRRQRRETASNCHPFVKFLSKEMARQRATLTDVADRSGVCIKTIGQWRSGGRTPKLRDIEAVVNVLGFELKLVPMKEE
jgi:transcriptional regulator with XRE-family HTH domain